MKKILFVSLFLSIVSIFLGDPTSLGFCTDGSLDCIELFSEKIAQPLFLVSISLFFISIVLFFTKQEVFKAWSRFALVAIPLLALWIILTPVRCGAALGICLDKEIVSWISSVGFLIVSLVIIIYKSLRLKKYL